MIGIQSCKDMKQALLMARAVEMAGPEVFSVTVADGVWTVWFRFDQPGMAADISKHFSDLENEDREFERGLARNRKAPGQKRPAKS